VTGLCRRLPHGFLRFDAILFEDIPKEPLMTALILLCLLTVFVAYANGANDNFKGVATLFCANVTDYRTAITIATLATFAGCAASIFLAEALVQAFSGKGLVPDVIASSPVFLLAVAAGASATVMFATILGFPVSTTHALTGALVGAGFVAAGDKLDLGVLGSAFFFAVADEPRRLDSAYDTTL
jgi:PiT family inorganic phosphate transporter